MCFQIFQKLVSSECILCSIEFTFTCAVDMCGFVVHYLTTVMQGRGVCCVACAEWQSMMCSQRCSASALQGVSRTRCGADTDRQIKSPLTSVSLLLHSFEKNGIRLSNNFLPFARGIVSVVSSQSFRLCDYIPACVLQFCPVTQFKQNTLFASPDKSQVQQILFWCCVSFSTMHDGYT